MPLRYGARVVGVIVVSKLGLNQFDEDDVRLLEVLAGHAAVAVENASLYESARREAESATQLLEFGRELASASSLDDILERIVGSTATLIGVAAHLDLDRGRRRLARPAQAPRPHATRSARASRQRRFHVAELHARASARGPSRSCSARTTTRTRTPEPLDPAPRTRSRRSASASAVGCIVAALPDGDFGERELRLLGGLAHQAQLAIANASNYEGLEQTLRLDRRGARERARGERRVHVDACALDHRPRAARRRRARASTSTALKRLELGALLHDIGKIGIPSEILSKPGRLTAEERALIETHPELGERIIAPIDRLQEVRDDRPPLPRALGRRRLSGRIAGDEIPLESRIIFVCDAYHAMTTDRPYRKRLSHPEAVRRLREGAGSQFDARVVEVCAARPRADLRR